MSRVQIAIYVVLGVALAISVVTDLRSRKIYNPVTFLTIALCLLLRLAGGLRDGQAWGDWNGPGLASGLLGAFAGGLPFLLMSFKGGMGGGDVKLVAAVGAGVGFPMILACLLFIGVAGGVEAIVFLVWKGKLVTTLGGMGKSVLQKSRLMKPDETPREQTKIPYGVAIAFGSVWGVVWTLMQPGALAAG